MNHFFAYLDRLKLIRRWGLMRNTVPENDMEHSMQTALIAHGLAVLGKTRHQRDIDPERVVMLALYHDVSEVITGDMPTPVKYKSPIIQDAYRGVEEKAREQLLAMLPDDMQSAFKPYIIPNENTYEWRLVKAADRISAYLKCVEEEKMGNRDFAHAKLSIQDSINQNVLPEVHEFMREFVPSFSLSPDELSRL
ncbi:MAG: 5'-deoxynucleotidase [Clostridia bacterium]|nr:5'-deoxynucleotidase [Clostridia bacterium]MBR3873462.1 5'-deoxynucleotidase [Clostridia bacterium]